jgi:putative hydrolase of the HAD superfamily
VFDLDNTLHDASAHIFPHINGAMTAYLERELGLGHDEANALRRTYWTRYGATLIGLIRHHGTNPGHFLAETHRFDDLPALLVSEPRLRHTLLRLHGRRLIFSNAPIRYSEAVLRGLGIADMFTDVFCIERARFRPKPDAWSFLRLARVHRLCLTRCIMVEDTLANLQTAKRLGMKTVWVSRERRTPAYVDYKIPSLMALPRLQARLQH